MLLWVLGFRGSKTSEASWLKKCVLSKFRGRAERWFAAKMGFKTAAIARGKDKEAMNEVFPLERAAEAYDRMMSGKARSARSPGARLHERLKNE
jgi:hypothetical protein